MKNSKLLQYVLNFIFATLLLFNVKNKFIDDDWVFAMLIIMVIQNTNLLINYFKNEKIR